MNKSRHRIVFLNDKTIYISIYLYIYLSDCLSVYLSNEYIYVASLKDNYPEAIPT